MCCRAVCGPAGPVCRSRASAILQRRAAQRDRAHRQGLSAEPSRAVARRDERARQAPADGRGGKASRQHQGARRHAFHLATPGDAGDPKGDVTVVEFFDYNCSYCKRAMSDMLDLMKDDRKLKFVLKEFPVLGEGSTQAAQVAAAVRMQDTTGGKKYLEFHQKLLGGRGQADLARALAAAKDVGLDVARIEKDMASDEVKATIEENFKLAEALGLNGTPSYVVGNDVLVGAVGLNTLKEKVNGARCGKPTC